MNNVFSEKQQTTIQASFLSRKLTIGDSQVSVYMRVCISWGGVKSLLYRVYGLLNHPSATKRLGAYVAVKPLASVLKPLASVLKQNARSHAAIVDQLLLIPTTNLCVYMLVCLSVCLSHNLSVCLSVCVCLRLSVWGLQINLAIWDTAGQERFHALGPIYYRDADGALIGFLSLSLSLARSLSLSLALSLPHTRALSLARALSLLLSLSLALALALAQSLARSLARSLSVPVHDSIDPPLSV